MRLTAAAATLAVSLPLLLGTAERPPLDYRAAGTITTSDAPYLPGSVVPVRVAGFSPPYRVAVIGPGSLLENGSYDIPSSAAPGAATLVAGNAAGIAARTIAIGAAPSAHRSLIAVASYDDGVVFHDASTFARLGTLAIGGAPADVASDADGRVAAADTQGTTLTTLTLAPWSVARTENVPFGDDVAIDATTGAIFVSNRDLDGSGALTRVLPDGRVGQVATGRTAEGMTIDERRQLVYVANVNDDSVAVVDAATLEVRRHFHAVQRVFSLALSPDGTRLYAVSNQTTAPPLGAPGGVVAISLAGTTPRIVARSAVLAFPVGEALDAKAGTLFVTDEAADEVYVLDARTLRAKRAPLATCRTPWKPELDQTAHRLYVPCARADEIDVFDSRTYRRVAGAPFHTGSYPLAVTVWHPRGAANR